MKNSPIALFFYLSVFAILAAPIFAEEKSLTRTVDKVDFKVTSVTTDRQTLQVRIDGYNQGGRTEVSLNNAYIYSGDGSKFRYEKFLGGTGGPVAASFPFNFTLTFPALAVEEKVIPLLEMTIWTQRGGKRQIIEFRNVPIVRTDGI